MIVRKTMMIINEQKTAIETGSMILKNNLRIVTSAVQANSGTDTFITSRDTIIFEIVTALFA